MDFTVEDTKAAFGALSARFRRMCADLEARRTRLLEMLVPLAHRLVDEHHATAVYLVGSLDQPWFGPESDVDLVVAGLPAGGIPDAERLSCETLGVHVDFLVWEELPLTFRERVQAEGTRLA